MNNDNLYNQICRVLTNYEEMSTTGKDLDTECSMYAIAASDMYDVLVNCQRMFDSDMIPADYHDQCMESESTKRLETEKRAGSLEDFCKFVSECILAESFESGAGFFAEVAARKLEKLGFIKASDDGLWWVLDEK